MKITFAEKELKDYLSNNKPVIYEGETSFPYDRLNPFDFEDLTYFAIKQSINEGEDWNGFNQIESLGGVKDKGRDCILKSDEIVRGIIQCKHSEKQYKLIKSYFIKELLKFLLYSIKEPSLIDNPEQFTYYIFSSSGYNKDTIELIDNFKELIFKEQKIKSWVNGVINKHSSIRELLNYENCKERLNDLLSSITVKKIKTKDFDWILNQPYSQNIVDAFFSIKKVIDIDTADRLFEKHLNPIISYKEAMKSLDSSSYDFKILTNYFGQKKDTHIERKETSDLYGWVLEDIPVSKKNISVLVGNAGLGKTIVLKDLYEKLIENSFPVLAIKADKYYAEDRIKLEEKIFQKSNVAITQVIDCLSNNHQKIIILIDQLDALSQTLSSKRDYIHTYNRLIDDLSKYPNVRVVISVRSFDLKFDSDLATYNDSSCQKFSINELSTEEIEKVLGKFGIHNKSEKFLTLLKIPSSLNLFCKLKNKSSLNYDSLKTIYDLQNAFWDELISESQTLGLNLKQLLYLISEKMYEVQQITINNTFRDYYLKELNFLKSKNVIIDDSRGIQFFHQTFYDFVFSKQFVETGKSLISYIKKENQSINVRQPIKMVLEYLREYNHAEYIKSLRQIIRSKRFRFHIKSLVIISLSNISKPSAKEKQTFKKYIRANGSFFEMFISSATSEGWVSYLINKGVLYDVLSKEDNNLLNGLKFLRKKKLIPRIFKTEILLNSNSIKKNAIFGFLRNNIDKSSDVISKFLLELPEQISEKEYIIQRLLTDVKNWNENYFKLFEEYYSYKENTNKRRDNFWYFEILKKISNIKPSYSLEKIKPALKEAFDPTTTSVVLDDFEHSLKEIIKHLFELHPKISFNFFYVFMKNIIEENKRDDEYSYYGELVKSDYFAGAGARYNIPSADENIYKELQNYLTKLVEEDINAAEIFLRENIYSNITSVLQLCGLTLSVNPSFFKNLTFEFLNVLNQKKCFNWFDDRLQLVLRSLVGKTFCFFSSHQKEKVIDLIFSIRRGNEFRVDEWDGKKHHRLDIQGKKQYLFIQKIPESEISKNFRLKRKFQEFRRKYGVLKDVSPMDESSWGGITYGVSRPLKESAYKFMSLEHWEKSMLKYDDTYRPDFSSRKGDIYQHSNEFNETVKKNPKRFYPFLDRLISEKKVSDDYIFKGFRGLVEAYDDAPLVFKMYKRLIEYENLTVSNLLNLLWSTEFLVHEKLIDEEILDFLSILALSHPNPDKVYNKGNPEHDINQTVRSVAVKMVIWSGYNKIFANKIFEVLEKSVLDKEIAVRVSVLANIHYVKILDAGRAFKIFNVLVDTDRIDLLKNSFRAADYFKYEFFDNMTEYFNRIIRSEELHEHGAVIISKAIIENSNFKASNELLAKLTEESEVAICSVLNVAETNLFYENKFSEECFTLLMTYLKVEGDDIASRYSGFILRKLNVDNFETFHSFLQEYVKSTHVKKEPNYFYQLLTSCAKNYPMECLDLFKKTFDIDNSDIQERGYIREEPVQVALAIYNSLNKQTSKNIRDINNVLDIFDSLLKNPRLRGFANNAINSI